MGHATFAQAGPQTAVPQIEGSATVNDSSQSKMTALARFEFESGKGKEGSKVLMAEWDTSLTSHESLQGSPRAPDQESHPTSPAWEVSWEDMPVTIAVRDKAKETQTRERQYFLLPPGCQVPTNISITHRTGSVISAKPLPAIYPEGLGLEVGSKGVLHTMWAKSRVADLEEEMRNEMSVNVESVGLEMVSQEKEWILDQFGIALSPDATGPSEKVPTTIVSPKHHLPGRLADQFRGLKLATSPEDLAAAATARHKNAPGNAIQIPTLSKNGSHQPQCEAAAPVTAPPQYRTGNPEPPVDEEDLFALPMSPRSPEMKRSPFSLL